MSDEAQPPKPEESSGAPAWMVTFADLMTLLMCFFVLLVAFSELDIQRYRMIAGSLKMAFGVQREFKGIDIPKGTSLLAREFSPGKPARNPISEMRQSKIDEVEQTLENFDGMSPGQPTEESNQELDRIIEVLAEEIDMGIVHVEGFDDRIVIRIEERGMFASGSATLNPEFAQLVSKLGGVMARMDGTIAVAGHTAGSFSLNARGAAQATLTGVLETATLDCEGAGFTFFLLSISHIG